MPPPGLPVSQPQDASIVQEICLIAGNGEFPRMFIEAAHGRSVRVHVVGMKGETEPAVKSLADSFTWVEVGQLQALIDGLLAYAPRQVAMAGGVKKVRFFLPVKADKRALSVAGRLLAKKDDGILRAVARELESEGFEVVASTLFLAEAMAPAGNLSARAPTEAELKDLAFGFQLAKDIGSADVGQTVVVKDQVPLAVEAIEGTDACLARGGALGRGGATAVKVVKPGQDFRFDLPAVGPRTIQVLKKAGITALGLEAGSVLLIDRARLLQDASRAGIALYGLTAGLTAHG